MLFAPFSDSRRGNPLHSPAFSAHPVNKHSSIQGKRFLDLGHFLQFEVYIIINNIIGIKKVTERGLNNIITKDLYLWNK